MNALLRVHSSNFVLISVDIEGFKVKTRVTFLYRQVVAHDSFLVLRTTPPGKTNTLKPCLKVLHTPQPSKLHFEGKNLRSSPTFHNKC